MRLPKPSLTVPWRQYEARDLVKSLRVFSTSFKISEKHRSNATGIGLRVFQRDLRAGSAPQVQEIQQVKTPYTPSGTFGVVDTKSS